MEKLLWFIRGNTDNTILKEQGVHIWDANCSREYLDSVGLNHYKENQLGPVYGHQWRNFNAPWTVDAEEDTATAASTTTTTTNSNCDQLQYIINNLKNPATRNSRRLIMSAWNPCQLSEMALPPCHIMCQFHVSGGNRLSCALYQRSGDVGLGVPFNIASYSFLTHLLAKHCGLVAHEFIHFLGNTHIYEDHIEQMREQITRACYEFPTVEIVNTRDDINDYILSDFIVHEYKSHETLKMQMKS